MKITDLYYKNTPMELDWFIELMAQYPNLEFFQPAPVPAPWHVQCRLPNGYLLNVWPHAGKLMIQDEPPVTLWVGAQDLINQTLEREPYEEPDLIEDY